MEHVKSLMINQLKLLMVDWQIRAQELKDKKDMDGLVIVSENFEKLKKLVIELESNKQGEGQ